MNKLLNLSTSQILFSLLIFVKFFGLSVFPAKWYIVDIIIIIYLSIAFRVNKLTNIFNNDVFGKSIYWFIIFVILSSLYSIIFNQQDPKMLVCVSLPYYGFLTFFFLKACGISSSHTFKILIIISVLMNICYIVQWLLFPRVFFYFAEAELEAYGLSGVKRIRFVCSLCSYLLFFYGINKFILERKMKFIGYSLLGGFPIIVMGFRSLVGLVILAIPLLIFFTTNKFANYFKYIVMTVLFSFVALQTPIVQDKISEMSERQEQDATFSNSEYIRYIALAYYEDYYDQNIVQRIIGGGIPILSTEKVHQAGNKYQMDTLNAYNMKLYWNDLGIIGLSYMLGIPAIIILCFICYLIMRNSKRAELQFIRFSIFVAFFGSILTSQEIYRDGNFAIMGVIMYYLHTLNNKEIIDL